MANGFMRKAVAGAVVFCAAAWVCGAQGVVGRAVRLESATDSESAYCAEMDGGIFARAGAGLRGVTLEINGKAAGFAVTVSAPESAETTAAGVENLHETEGGLEFDLRMPERAYTELVFRLRSADVVARVEVRGVGEFTIFDLSGRKMGRRMMVELPQEMSAKTLHIVMRFAGKRLSSTVLSGVDVPPAREAQSLWTTIDTSTSWTKNFQNMVVSEFDVGAHVPVQMVRFEWDKTDASFRSGVRLEAWPLANPGEVETAVGEISATHTTVNGVRVDGVEDVVPMTLGANLQGPAHVRVVVENAGESAVKLRAVALEMRQHELCFMARQGQSVVLQEDEAGTTVAPQAENADWSHAKRAVFDGEVAVKSRQDVEKRAGGARRFRGWGYFLLLILPLVLLLKAIGVKRKR